MYLKSVLICSFLLLSIYGLASARRRGSIYSMKSNDTDNHWKNFKRNYSKSYQNSTREAKKKQTFISNLNRINEHNKKYNNGTATYEMDVNSMADMTSEEFMDYVNKGLNQNSFQNNTNSFFSRNKRATIPASVDWRTMAKVNAVKNQGQCGSCSAFSANSALESAYAITNGVLPNLSEQNLVDCTYGYDMCQTGGWYYDEWNYIKNNKGINDQTSYPYVSGSSKVWSGSCKYSKTGSFNPQITGYVQVQANEAALAEAIATVGPVSVAIYVSSNFQMYRSGVFTDTTCPFGQLNHAVTLVGYGTDSTSGKDYYILRNSWGTSWGSSGYMNFQRNNNNMCGIASYAMYPTVAKSSSASTTPAPKASTAVPVTTVKPATVSTSAPTILTTVLPTTIPVTTLRPITTTSTNQTKPLCYNGTGDYPNPNCQSYYKCTLKIIDNFSCPYRYLFNFPTQTCRSKSQVVCNPSPYVCPNGPGLYYPNAGCQYVYLCQSRTIQTFTCPTGQSYNPYTRSCANTGSFTCPV